MQIPELATPVVEVLRRDVPKPKASRLKMRGEEPRWSGGECPGGLHYKALNNAPCAYDLSRWLDVPGNAATVFIIWNAQQERQQ